MFIGRDKELTSLCELLKKPGKHAAIYGVRRIGKTTLAQKAAIDSGHIFISYESLISVLYPYPDMKKLIRESVTASTGTICILLNSAI